jgi:hypothetical protein
VTVADFASQAWRLLFEVCIYDPLVGEEDHALRLPEEAANLDLVTRFVCCKPDTTSDRCEDRPRRRSRAAASGR